MSETESCKFSTFQTSRVYIWICFRHRETESARLKTLSCKHCRKYVWRIGPCGIPVLLKSCERKRVGSLCETGPKIGSQSTFFFENGEMGKWGSRAPREKFVFFCYETFKMGKYSSLKTSTFSLKTSTCPLKTPTFSVNVTTCPVMFCEFVWHVLCFVVNVYDIFVNS